MAKNDHNHKQEQNLTSIAEIQTKSIDPVAAAIAAAKAAAERVPNTYIPPEQGGTVMMVATQPGRARSLDDMMAKVGTSCDLYMKATVGGILLGDKETYVEEIDATLKMVDIKGIYTIQCKAWSPPFRKSTDGVVCDENGFPWAQMVQEAARLDPASKGPYDAYMYVVTTSKAIKCKVGEPLPAGTTLGYTTSRTNGRTITDWLLNKRGKFADDHVFKVRLVHQNKKSNGNTWGSIVIRDME